MTSTLPPLVQLVDHWVSIGWSALVALVALVCIRHLFHSSVLGIVGALACGALVYLILWGQLLQGAAGTVTGWLIPGWSGP